MRKFLLISLFFCSLNSLQAQEQRVFSQFFMNPYIYNPAYAGVEGHTAVFMVYRNQWAGLEGSPVFYHVNFHTPLKGGFSFGALAYSEEESVLKSSGIKATLGYLVAFDKKHYLRFGMSLGAGISSLDLSQVDNPFDPAFTSLLNSSSHMIADFGITYHTGLFNFGVSLPNLISREVFTEDSFSKIKVSPTDNILVKVNFRAHINHDFAIEPHLIYRFSNVNASQYEAAVIFHLKHLVWVGGSYRQDAGPIALVGFKVKEKIGIGYAFELGNSDINSFTGSTHEVHIGFHIGTKKKHHAHAHSFIKSHSLTPEERAKLADKKRQERLAKLQASREEVTQIDDPIDDKTDVVEKVEVIEVVNNDVSPVEDTTNDKKVINDEIDNNDTENVIEDKEEVDVITDEIEVVDTEDKPEPKSANPNTVTRGSHFLELPVGNHIIAGSFKEFDHAEKYSDELFQRGFHDTRVGFVTAKGFYYTVVLNTPKFSTAISQKNRIKQMRGMEEVWILTVE